MTRKALAAPVRVRPWARRAKAVNPAARAPQRELIQLRADLPLVQQRMWIHGFPIGDADLSRSALTKLQRELRDATETSQTVAADDFLQQFRKHLHLLLDH